jgi:hypothetical protein
LTVFDPAAADAAKVFGMARADLGANPSWSAQMEAHAVAVARAMRFFTSDDVFYRAQLFGMTESTRDQRAFGPVMLRIARAGICRKADRAPVNSERTTLHSSPRAVWESLIFHGARQ